MGSAKKDTASGLLLARVRAFYSEYMAENSEFKPGDSIRYAGRVFDDNEVANAVDAALEFWLTTGRYSDIFERKLADYLGIRFCSLVNSGSSANLLALMALTADELGERKIERGDEVITVAAAFPTTVAPIVQYGAVPVFVDVELGTYNIDVTKLEGALSARTKAVFLAHTLGNPFDAAAVRRFCDNNGLWLIEDNCDALGAAVIIGGKRVLTGTIGDIGTSSFYPAHHITTGEGGAVYTDNPLLNKITRSLRDWGRDCVCPGGRDGVCGNRFDGQFGDLPKGYDHKYVYSRFGYNLKMTDMQAAIGCAQMDKLPGFVAKRQENAAFLQAALSCAGDKLLLPITRPGHFPSPFGLAITADTPERKGKIVNALEDANVQTRSLFAGNILLHPCFDDMRKRGEGYRVYGGLTNTDRIVTNTFWIGVYPGMTRPMLQYMADVILSNLS